MNLEIPFWLAGSYLTGAVPFSYLTAKICKGIDIREHGSGNPGATNVYRVAGPVYGVIAFVLDFLKGFLPVFIAAQYLYPGKPRILVLTALFAVVGHMWTVFLKFKGGKGVATGAGVFFALIPVPAAIAFAIFWMVFFATRYVSIGSIIAAAALPAIAFISGEPRAFSYFALIIGLLVIFQHRSNIRKLFSGTEAKFGTKKNDEKH